MRELRGDLARGIADGNRRAAGSRRDHRTRASLVGAECALAVVLLACGALLLSALRPRLAVRSRVSIPTSVLGAQLRLSATAYPTEAARAALITRVLERVRGIPGVVSAGATLNRFVPGFFIVTAVHIEGKPTPDGQAHTMQFRRASPGYFGTMRIPLLQGRDFAASDGIEQPAVAVVSRLFAEQHWPGEDPIGRRIRRGTNPRWLTVVGVVGDVSDVGFSQPPAPTLYICVQPEQRGRSRRCRWWCAPAAIRWPWCSAVRAAVFAARSCAADRLGDHARTVPGATRSGRSASAACCCWCWAASA